MLRLSREHNGNKIVEVKSMIIFLLFRKNEENPKVCARDENVSPMIIEQAKDAMRHFAVIPADTIHAVRALTDFAQTSWNDLD